MKSLSNMHKQMIDLFKIDFQQIFSFLSQYSMRFDSDQKNFALNTSRNCLEKSILIDQSKLHHDASKKNKTSRNNLASPRKIVRFQGRSSFEQQSIIKRNVASIHKEQMLLKNIDNANELIKSRLEDEKNLLDNYEKFPYDKENIDIKEDVLQRYRRNGDYESQSRMLDKFRREAEQLKRLQKMSRGENRIKKFEAELRNYDDSEKRKRELELLRKKMQKQLDEEKRLRELEQMKMKKISSSLNGLANQLQNNAFTFEKGIRELHNKLNNRPKQIRLPKKSLPYPDTLDLQLSSQKIPIVVYNDQPFDARLYFSEMYKQSSKVNPKTHRDSSGQKASSYEAIKKILNENNKRLQYLEALRENNDY